MKKIRIKKQDSIMLWSSDYVRLADFYEHVFALELVEELELPNDTGRMYRFGDPENHLWIGKHSQVSGSSKDPYRIMLGFVVEDLDSISQTLKDEGVVFVAEKHLSPTKDYHVATIKDPDGNIIQLFQYI